MCFWTLKDTLSRTNLSIRWFSDVQSDKIKMIQDTEKWGFADRASWIRIDRSSQQEFLQRVKYCKKSLRFGRRPIYFVFMFVSCLSNDPGQFSRGDFFCDPSQFFELIEKITF